MDSQPAELRADPPPWRVGVDVVSRKKRDASWTEHLERRGCFTDHERAWIAAGDDGALDANERALILVSAKESSIKAMGGRSSGWEWTHVSFDTNGDPDSRHLELLDIALEVISGDVPTGKGTFTMTPEIEDFAAECIGGDPAQPVVFTAAWVCGTQWIATVTVLERARPCVAGTP